MVAPLNSKFVLEVIIVFTFFFFALFDRETGEAGEREGDDMFLTLVWAILTFPLLSAFMLSYAKHILTPASYSHTQDWYRSPYFTLWKKVGKAFFINCWTTTWICAMREVDRTLTVLHRRHSTCNDVLLRQMHIFSLGFSLKRILNEVFSFNLVYRQ